MASTPTRPAVPRWVGKAKLAEGTEIQLCVRPIKPGNAFAVSPAPFDCSRRVLARRAPFGWSVAGRAIHEVVDDLHPRHAEVLARQVDTEKDPTNDSLSAITVDDEDNSYFDEYVAKTASGGAVMFVDVEVE